MVELPEQPGQGATLAPVDAVEGRVLRNQRQFLHSPGGKCSRLRQDQSAGRLPIRTARVGNDANAHFSRALGNLHVGIVARPSRRCAVCRS